MRGNRQGTFGLFGRFLHEIERRVEPHPSGAVNGENDAGWRTVLTAPHLAQSGPGVERLRHRRAVPDPRPGGDAAENRDGRATHRRLWRACQIRVAGARFAVEEINQSGGILGRPVELLVADSANDIATGVQKTRELIERDQAEFIPAMSTRRWRWR